MEIKYQTIERARQRNPDGYRRLKNFLQTDSDEEVIRALRDNRGRPEKYKNAPYIRFRDRRASKE